MVTPCAELHPAAGLAWPDVTRLHALVRPLQLELELEMEMEAIRFPRHWVN